MEKKREQGVQRLRSVDALRGFDMFWIAGGGALFAALADLTGSPALLWWKTQMEHVEWHGFRFEDMIFPLFLFIAVIGMNSLAVYLVPRVVDFDKVTQFFFGSLIALAPGAWHDVLNATASLAVVWAFLYVLYRKKIFLKV